MPWAVRRGHFYTGSWQPWPKVGVMGISGISPFMINGEICFCRISRSDLILLYIIFFLATNLKFPIFSLLLSNHPYTALCPTHIVPAAANPPVPWSPQNFTPPARISTCRLAMPISLRPQILLNILLIFYCLNTLCIILFFSFF